ncbi:uncharacterized protein [Rutidosis leptorrhynchoides]|uniref:uncharacterized protein n=1 Tax=Rutidosis leptorrhynchoides TaxID=125765 RepID=UPI003A995E89
MSKVKPRIQGNEKKITLKNGTERGVSFSNEELKKYGEQIGLRGFAVAGKFGWVKEICRSKRPFVVAFQETKCYSVSGQWVEALWGNSNFGYIQKEVVGNSGGLLLVWDTCCFKASDAMGNEFFFAIRGKWKASGEESFIVNIYGPNDDSGKKIMLDSLENLLMANDSAWLLCGDFNEVFDAWCDKEDVGQVIYDAWLMPVQGYRKDCIFQDKLKNVKSKLKTWSKDSFGTLDYEINTLRKEVSEWEKKAELNSITDGECTIWLECRKKWLEKEKVKADMLRQKARIRWVLDGDENSKLFHNSIRHKYKKCNFRGLNINGLWNDNPSEVKKLGFNHFKMLFSDAICNRPRMADLNQNVMGLVANSYGPVDQSSTYFGPDKPYQASNKADLGRGNLDGDGSVGFRLTETEAALLDQGFSDEEIWGVVKGCASLKAPGPDGFNKKF